MYLNIFIVLNLYLTKLVQFDNQGLDFNYNYYNFFNDTSYIFMDFIFIKLKYTFITLF